MIGTPQAPREESMLVGTSSLSSSVPLEEQGHLVRRHARVTFEKAAFLVLVLAAGWCWAVLARWYSLPEHRSHTHFAFEKLPGGFASPILRGTLLLFLALAFAHVAGYVLLRRSRGDSPAIRLGVVALVVGPGIANVLVYPVGALDVFNYMVELKLAYHYDQNPYLATFAGYRDDPFALPAFLVDVPLFYGPAWLLASAVPGLLVGYDDFVELLLALKVFNLALLVLTSLAIYRYQEDGKRGLLAAYLFLANPLVLFEGVGNAHNDVLMTLFLVAALLALKRRSLTAAPLLALSALVKFFTAALAPLFVLVALAGKWRGRTLVSSALLSLAVVVVTTAPFWAGGQMMDGLARGSVASQRMDHVSVVSLAQQYVDQVRASKDGKPWLAALVRPHPRPQPLTDDEKRPMRRLFGGLFALFALLIAWTVKWGREFEAAVVATLMLFALLLTNLYPWYLIPVFAVVALRRDRLGLAYLFAATALGLAYYPAYVYAHFNSGWVKFHAHVFLALFLTLPMVAFLALDVWRLGSKGKTEVGRTQGPATGAPAVAASAALDDGATVDRSTGAGQGTNGSMPQPNNTPTTAS
ncbi:MAG: hypothetical protein M3Q10_18405 [Chloroflexota bacterium]|nr:hypothetical protein [Chloroflexota bacterium]